jgi:hypothetical protein
VERVLNSVVEAGVLPATDLAPVRRLLAQLAPLWRHTVWFTALALVLAASVAIRLDVQRMQKDYARTIRTQREARVLQDRLRLELDARRRATAMESLAQRHQLIANPLVVHVGRAP